MTQPLTEKVPSGCETAQGGGMFTALESDIPELESWLYQCLS